MSDEIFDVRSEDEPGRIGRREFFDRLALTVGATAALTFAGPDARGDDLRSQNPAPQAKPAPIVAPDDNRLTTGTDGYDVAGTRMQGYSARAKEGGKRPAVIVISENRGLNAHIKDVARRFALEGYLAFAPDALSPLGGTPEDESQAAKMIGSLDNDETVRRLAAAVNYMAKQLQSTGKVGVVGFCWGGGMVNQLAAAGTSLNAGVAYYGRTLPAAQVPKISCPLLLHYASLDQRINAGIPEFEAALKADKKVYEIYMYEGANHAFNNDTGPRYDKAAATLAWSRTVAWFRKYLA